MQAKRLWWLCVPGLLACPGPGPKTTAGPNGKQGVLFFFPDAEGPVAQGLEMEVLVPARLTSIREQHRLEYDFEDTELEVEADEGVSVVGAWRYGRSWRFVYRCEPAKDGEREVRVRVRGPDGAERYADALGVTCLAPTELTFLAVGSYEVAPSPAGISHSVPGAQVRFIPQAWSSGSRETQALHGRGELRLEDPQGTVRHLGEEPRLLLGDTLTVETLRPGGGVEVHLSGLRAPLPLQVVERSAVRVAVTAQRVGSGKYWQVRAGGVLVSDGVTEVGGLGPCDLEVRPFIGANRQERGTCTTVIHDESSSRGEVCATLQGETVCTNYGR